MKIGSFALEKFLGLIGVVSLPLLFHDKYIHSIFVFTEINIILAIALNILFGQTGIISLGQAGFFGLGAYAAAILTVKFGYSPAWGLLLAVLLPASLAYVIARPILKLQLLALCLATLALGEILYIIFSELKITGGWIGIPSIPALFSSNLPYYYLFAGIIALLLWMSLNLSNSRIGLAMRAIREDDVAAAAMGIDTAKLKALIFSLCAGITGLAGWLYAHFVTFISPETFNGYQSVIIVIFLVVGGRFNIWGALLGGIVMSIIPEMTRALKEYQNLIYGAFLLIILVAMPNGLMGLVQQFKDRHLKPIRPAQALDDNSPKIKL